MEPGHVSVMPREIVDYLQGVPSGTVVDGTAGGGGHTALLSDAFPDATILAFERDPSAFADLKEKFSSTNVQVINKSYTSIPQVISENGFPPATAVLFDLGLSSIQLDDGSRGFSHRFSGSLDMRFNPLEGKPVHALLARMTEKQIADTIYKYGEEGRSRVIARAIKNAGRITTTDQLVETVKSVVRGNPVKPLSRVFQAFRIMVNNELQHLEILLSQMHTWTGPGCRAAILTFHSIEDRMVKLHFRDSENFKQNDPPWMVPCTAEKRSNPRARSARLRLGIRL